MDANPSNQGTPTRSPTSIAVPSTNRIDPSYKRLNRVRFTVSVGEQDVVGEDGSEAQLRTASLTGGKDAPPNRGGGVLREAGVGSAPPPQYRVGEKGFNRKAGSIQPLSHPLSRLCQPALLIPPSQTFKSR